MSTPAPDFQRLRQIGEEAEKLHGTPAWTREAFERLWDTGLEACHGHTEFMEMLLVFAKPAWIKT